VRRSPTAFGSLLGLTALLSSLTVGEVRNLRRLERV
jgi:hypothetical protein